MNSLIQLGRRETIVMEKSNIQKSKLGSALDSSCDNIWKHNDFACGVGVGLAVAAILFLVMHLYCYFIIS